MSLRTRSGRPPSQREYELHRFIELLRAERVTRYLEVGARDGDTFFEIMRSLPKGATGVALDLPGATWGQGKSRKRLEDAVRILRTSGYDASCIFGDSTTPATHRLAAMRGPYDAVLIDGDHRYEGVQADWLLYRPLARIVAFHDIAGDGQTTKDGRFPVEVPRLWREIKQAHARHVEYIDHDNPGMGIGVVWP
jgi:predicted O-methyltransferase YrrM